MKFAYITLNDHHAINVSTRMDRSILNGYLNVFVEISKEEAFAITKARSFGFALQFGPNAPVFLGVMDMPVSKGRDALRSVEAFYRYLPALDEGEPPHDDFAQLLRDAGAWQPDHRRDG